MAKIYKTSYKDVDAVAFETDKLIAKFLPKLGGKLASLIDKRTGRQYMEQAVGEKYIKLSYAGDYVASECSAFDDMFPTVDKYRCNQFPWQGTEMPDHGEICGLPCEYEVKEDILHIYTYSVRFSYRFEKWISEKEGNISMRYKITNLSPFDFDGMYAPHCMIAGEEGAEVKLPYEKGSICTGIFHEQNEFGYADKLTWRGYVYPSFSDNRAFKFYFDDPIPEGWAICEYKDGSYLKMVFSADKLPWMALWINTGSFKGMHNIAIEPCSASYDRPDFARQHGKFSVISANDSFEFDFGFEVKD